MLMKTLDKIHGSVYDSSMTIEKLDSKARNGKLPGMTRLVMEIGFYKLILDVQTHHMYTRVSDEP